MIRLYQLRQRPVMVDWPLQLGLREAGEVSTGVEMAMFAAEAVIFLEV